MIERFFWVLMVGLSICGFSFLVRSNIIHFQDSPTVISLERDFRVWNTTFPAVTICYEDPMDEESAEKLVLGKWGERANDNDSMKYHLGFLSAVANASFMTLESFLPYVDDPFLQKLDLLPLALEVNKKFAGTIYIYTIEEINPKQTLTELGLCYTAGSLISHYTTPWQFANSLSMGKNGEGMIQRLKVMGTTRDVLGEEERGVPPPPRRLLFAKKKKEDTTREPLILTCNILNSLCYGRFSVLGGKISYYVHSAWEVPVWGAQKFTFTEKNQKDTIFKPLITVAPRNLRVLSESQRKCLFLDEGQREDGLDDLKWNPSFTGLPIYSYNLCVMSCRRKLAFHYCGCVPHFWSSSSAPVCKIDGLVCLNRYSEKLKKLEGPIYLVRDGNFKCNCYPQCNDISFSLDTDLPVKKPPVENEIRFRVAVEQFPRIRLRREIIFGREDLLVSLGGTAGLFLGCSVLSAAELVYFFTLRLWCYLLRRKKTRVKRRERKTMKNRTKTVTFK
ncbi:uncharacterized protein LOC124166485 [Ischnura elegans]|uniref:uncharacterized protein LOC124166485 n=1 Tax=Ischnura elegans TaxID=197161 RepID=UPI001ED8795B|nr:uncharacterized protein LOC124166485 [Ischnura elegans]